jgi:hypothetical protein
MSAILGIPTEEEMNDLAELFGYEPETAMDYLPRPFLCDSDAPLD